MCLARTSGAAVAVLLALALVAGTTACSSDDPDSSGGAGSDGDTPAGAEAVEEGAYPVSIDHKYGTTEISEYPERIVTVGLVEQDTLLALGVTPVGTTEWFGEHAGAIWPWAADEHEGLGGAEITVLDTTDGISAEDVAALRPDAIIALYAGLTEDEYAALSQVAPTVAQPEEYPDYGIPWQETTHKVGLVVGQPAAADAIVEEVEAQIDEARAAHPELEGTTGAVATPYEGIYVYGADDPRTRFLQSLGMEVPDELLSQLGEEFGGDLSEENAELLDVDVLVWLDPADAEGALGGPLYDGLAVHTEGREVLLDSYAEDGLGGATSFVTVLSLPYLLDGLTPMLSAAVDGDVATEVPPAPSA